LTFCQKKKKKKKKKKLTKAHVFRKWQASLFAVASPPHVQVVVLTMEDAEAFELKRGMLVVQGKPPPRVRNSGEFPTPSTSLATPLRPP
jgi:hypothetical protein